jgi:hypothetical protein
MKAAGGCIGSKAPARHWVAGNIPGIGLKFGDLIAGDTVSKFKGPSPPWGSHPYSQLLFKQNSTQRINFTTLPSPSDIYNWDFMAFAAQYGLGKPVANNWHVTQHADPRVGQ